MARAKERKAAEEYPHCPMTGKISFPSKHKAKKKLKQVNRIPSPMRTLTYPYLCACGAWHHTSRTR